MPLLYSLCTHVMKLYRGYPDLSITHHWLFGKSESRHWEKASPEDSPTSPQQNLQVQADSHVRASDSHTGLQKAMGRARPSPGRISRQVPERGWGCNPGDRELGSPGEHEDIKEGAPVYKYPQEQSIPQPYERFRENSEAPPSWSLNSLP